VLRASAPQPVRQHPIIQTGRALAPHDSVAESSCPECPPSSLTGLSLLTTKTQKTANYLFPRGEPAGAGARPSDYAKHADNEAINSGLSTSPSIQALVQHFGVVDHSFPTQRNPAGRAWHTPAFFCCSPSGMKMGFGGNFDPPAKSSYPWPRARKGGSIKSERIHSGEAECKTPRQHKITGHAKKVKVHYILAVNNIYM
jgi:hypothetical protein